MKKLFIYLVSFISFSLAYAGNQSEPKDLYDDSKDDSELAYIDEELDDEPFDFNYKYYIPEGFIAYDLNDDEYDSDQWVDEENEEMINFNVKYYLPVGFNASKKLNHLFLNKVELVDEEEDEPFDFDIKYYLEKLKNKNISI